MQFLGQSDLDAFCFKADSLHVVRIGAEVDAMFLSNLVNEVIRQPTVEVIAAEMSIAVGGQHFEDAVLELEDGDIESTAAEVVHSDRALRFLLKPIGE